MKIQSFAFAGLLAGWLAQAGPAQASVEVTPFAYVSAAASEPWGSSSNIEAMNAAFGAGNWSRLNFGDDITGFAFVYLDGGDQAGTAFVDYVGAHQALLQSYVNDGGRLLLNAASNNLDHGRSYALVFGASTQEGGTGYSTMGQATAAGAVLTGQGAGSSWSGDSFAHNQISHGAGFTALITGDTGQTLVAGGSFGYGYVMVGGQTSTLWHSGVAGSDPFQLRVNELALAAGVAAVPEPHTAALMLCGLAVLPWLARRRRSTTAA